MREKAAWSLLYNTVLTIVLMSAVIGYTVLIYQFGQQSAQTMYALKRNGCDTQTASFSVHKQKASLIALDVWRFADALVNQTE